MKNQSVASARSWRDEHYQHYLQCENIDIPGVEEVLKGLSQHFQMAVITTSKRADFELIHRQRSLLNTMSFVLCREDYVHAKPHAEPYETGMKRFGINPNNTLVIEDSKRGLAAAEAAGIKTIKVYNEFVAHQQAPSDYSIQTLQELSDLLSRINLINL